MDRKNVKKKLAPIMFVGTGSDVGKSLVNTGFCRLLLEDGYRPAPFKAQNMSLNSFVTPDGLELGRAQATQAEACKIPCSAAMNPILLKPNSDHTSQVVLLGKPIGNKSAKTYFNETDREALFARAMDAFDELSAKYNPIVIEGAGSISELNLKAGDIVNMRVALHTQAATYLVADIDRGGVFASVYGSIMLLSPEERKAIKGIIINKFRGDMSLFEEGKRILHDLTGVPVVGVLPYAADIFIEQEDSVSLDRMPTTPKANHINVGVVRLKHLSNFTDFNLLPLLSGVHLFYSYDPHQLAQADILILPGSKNTIADLLDLREAGIDQTILNHYRAGKPLYGICGGYQMMGKEIRDPQQIEGGLTQASGLGIFPTITTLHTGKETRQRTFRSPDNSMYGQGYEIHSGITETIGAPQPLVQLEDGTLEGYRESHKVWGSYLHGILDNPSVLTSVLRTVSPHFVVNHDYTQMKEQGYNQLARLLREHLDIDYMYQSMQL